MDRKGPDLTVPVKFAPCVRAICSMLDHRLICPSQGIVGPIVLHHRKRTSKRGSPRARTALVPEALNRSSKRSMAPRETYVCSLWLSSCCYKPTIQCITSVQIPTSHLMACLWMHQVHVPLGPLVLVHLPSYLKKVSVSPNPITRV